MSGKGKLYLIPSVLAEETQQTAIPEQVKKELIHIHDFLAENIRSARRFLSSLKIYESIEALNFNVLNKDSAESALATLLKPIEEGKDMGIISEAGCPGIADPGAMAVHYAHQHNIQVIPLVGPSSILLSLMASGLNGQRFAFHGYLPIDLKEASKAIKEFAGESKLKGQTQIFIETPYRNNALFQNLLKSLDSNVQLCIAMDLTGPSEFIKTHTISTWRKKSIELPKLPAVFLFLS